MKTIEIEKGWLPIFTGFYNTEFSCECEEQMIEDYEAEYSLSGLTWDDFEWDYVDYNKRVAEACVEAIEAKLKTNGFDIDIAFEKVSSPKQHNYRNDEIHCKFNFSKETLKQLLSTLTENAEDFEEYLKENFTSYDGFSSFYSNKPSEWIFEYLNPTFEKYEFCLNCVIDFVLSYVLEFDVDELIMTENVAIETYTIGMTPKEK